MNAPIIPVARPRLAAASQIAPYLREIDANAWYANYGPLTHRLHARLAAHWGVGKAEMSLLANATVGLTLTLMASGARAGKRCLMPSWTFAASAGAVRAAGLVPHFMDVDAATWALDPAAAAALARARPDIGAILVVAPFGAPLDLGAWDDVQRQTGIPVVIDAAAAFDTLRDGGPMIAGACPVIVSLHATKVFGIGEGGALIWRDAAMLERVRRLSNFGFLGTRESMLPGVNGKMSEYAAAVGLAGLDGWRATRARWADVTGQYRRVLTGIDAVPTPGFGEGWVSSTLSVLVPRERSVALDKAGIGTLRWWGPGCHAQPAYLDCPREALPATEALAETCVGLPFWQDLSTEMIDRVGLALAGRPPKAASPVVVHDALVA